MHRVFGRAFVLVFGLAACTGTPSTSVDGPLIRYPDRSSNSDGASAEIRGILEFDGDCLFVKIEDATERYPVLWPAGTKWDSNGRAVITPRGESLENGDEIVGSGGYFTVDDIGRLADSEAADLARRCIDNEYGEVAVLNNSDSSIRLA